MVYLAIAVLLSSCKNLISGAFVSRPIKITLFISSSSFFCSDLLVPYESGLDSIESTKTIYYHCIRLSFLRPHITKRSEGKIQWANAKNFIFLFLSLTYTKEEQCFYRVLKEFFLFLCKKIAIRLHFLKSYSFAIDNIELLLVLIIRITLSTYKFFPSSYAFFIIST